VRRQAADQRDVRVVPQLDGQVRVLVGELPKDDATVSRRSGRPRRQLLCHPSMIAC
jgi:hypothetical protein